LLIFKNPQKIKGWIGASVDIADVHLPVKINEDIPLIKAILKKLYEQSKQDKTIFDHDFIKTYTDGYTNLLADLEHYDLASLMLQSGVSESEIDAQWHF